MAEFHAAGFSEFDQFFGGDSSSSNINKDEALGASKNEDLKQSSRKGKRGGVGATISPASSGTTELSKRLLKVGTKRSRHHREDVEEEYNVNDNRDDDNDDDEEDVGRTGIYSQYDASKTTKSQQDLLLVEGLPPSKKKKLGKKERQRLKEEADKKQNEATTSKTETGESSNPDVEGDGDGGAVSNNNNNNNNKKTKPKRRKIRSRQKNIRKDTRSMGEKPKHLRVGASNYQGRPLTDETRARLNLAPSKTKTNPFFVIDRAPAPKVEAGIELGVDALLAEPSPAAEDVTAKKKKKKKSKKKYKNL